MQVGTTKDHGLYNKPSAAVHPGVLAAGTLPQYNTICKHHGAKAFRVELVDHIFLFCRFLVLEVLLLLLLLLVYLFTSVRALVLIDSANVKFVGYDCNFASSPCS